MFLVFLLKKKGELWGMNGEIEEDDWKNELIIYDSIDTTPGQSGSPLFFKYSNHDNGYAIVGVHTGSNGMTKYGTRITRKKLEWIESILSHQIRLDPRYHHYYIDNSLFDKNCKFDHENAKIFYEKALEINPEDSNSHNGYALILHYYLNNPSEAEIHYKKGIECNPMNAFVCNNYACLLESLKDYNQAKIYYKKALKINPDYYLAHMNYANILEHYLRDMDNAMEHRELAKKCAKPY